MGRSLIAVGIALGFASLHVGCGGGTLSGGGAGTSGGSAGAGGSVVLTGMGGGVVPTGAGGDASTPCVQPMPATALPPNFLIALDTSATMNSLACPTGCGSASRWQIAVDAINATTGVTEDLANWGLQLFADGTNACGTIDAVGVPFGTGAAQRIAAALASRTTFGGDLANPSYRPTRNAVATAAGYLARQTTANYNFVVLVTTGAPGCAAGASDPLSDDSTVTVQEITKANSAGFPTFVVGLGTMDEPAQASLLNMAAAGGAGLGTAGHTGYFAVTSSVDLQSVLRSLVSDNAGCMFTVPPPPNQYLSRDSINVSLGGVPIPADANDGWSYLDSTHTAIQLHGEVCAAARADRTQAPAITFRCLLF
jgi:hypothetical protein